MLGGQRMSTARVPGSLRFAGSSHAPSKAAPSKTETKAATLVTAALLTAASPVGVALAQGTLPPLNVEASQHRKKAKAAPAAKTGATAQPADAPSAPAKDANPYADPNAPYKVDKSASGKFTEPLVNTPKSITAIPQQVIEDKAATSIRELARQTPGVTLGFGEGGNAFGDRIFIRGFDARGDIYIDGMRDPGNTSREVFAVEQAEVYKGPGGVIGGRGTPGGALNIVTKKPNEYDNFYNLSTMFGTDNTLRTTVDVNQVVSPWMAVRGNVLYHQSEVAGRDFVEDERWGGFFSTVMKPGDGLKVTLDYYRLRTDGVPDFGVPANPVTKRPWTESGLPRDTWYGNAMRDFMKNESDIATATIEAKLVPGVTLTSRTRVGRNVTDYIATAPGQNLANFDLGLVSIGNPQRYQETEFIANQTDVTTKFTTGTWRHTLVAGVELSREEVGRFGYTGLNQGVPAPVTQPLFDPDPFRGLLNPGYNNIGPKTLTFDATVDTQAVYLLDTIKLSEQWYVNGGIRLDHFERSQTNADGSSLSRDDTTFTYHAGIVYKPIPIASIYAAIATAASPSGSDLDANSLTYGGLDPNTAKLDPERATGLEIGTKWELFNRRLLATAALFQTEKDHARELVPVPDPSDPSKTVNTPMSTGAYRVRGIDLSVQGNITDRWSVFGGVVVMDTEVTRSRIGANVGLDLANVPTMQFSLLSKYKVTENLTVGGQAIYANEIKGGTLAASTGFETVPYWRFDALAEYKFTDNFSAQLNVVNLTDEVYYDTLYQSPNPFVFVAPGRAGYLTLSWKY
jgi:catecholate siderophore receptor